MTDSDRGDGDAPLGASRRPPRTRKTTLLAIAKPRLRVRVPPPRRVQLTLTAGDAKSPTVTINGTRLRR